MIDVVLVVSRGARGGGGAVRGPAVLAAGGFAVLAGGALLVGCGSSGSSAPPATGTGSAAASASTTHATSEGFAERVCGSARQAAAKALGSALAMRIVSPQAANLECVLTGRQVQVTVGSQAGPRAYTEFDTTSSHYS
jgi:hypothetical protein